VTQPKGTRFVRSFVLALCAASLAVGGAQAQTKQHRGQPQQQDKQEKKEGGDESKTQAYESNFPTKATWNLSDINGKAPPAEATLTIDENLRGAGVSGCNTWSAALYPVRGHKLAMGPVAQTKKVCSNELMQFERMYLTILHSGPGWDLVGSTLTIKGQAGTLIFNRGL
jgi:heat shock protein HslJ